jgi:DNA-binding NtrC family response regulator
MEARVDLVADRFVVDSRGTAIDLSTGDAVELVTSMSGGPTEHARWANRCGRFAALHHASFARLLDYGAVGEVRRFEAWRCDGPWQGSSRESERVVSRADEFLRACGWTVGALNLTTVRRLRGRPVVLPDSSTGVEGTMRPVDGSHRIRSIDFLGLTTIAHEGVSVVSEVFGQAGVRRSRAIALTGPRGVGLDIAVSELARAARLRGYVPLSPGALGANVESLLGERSIVLMIRADVQEGWRTFVSMAILSPKPHVLVFVGDQEVLRVCAVALGRASPETLRGSIQPGNLPTPIAGKVAAAAKRANGLPGRFATLLWGRRDMDQPVDRTKTSRAAENRVSYGQETTASASLESDRPPTEWPAPGELGSLRKRLAAGLTMIGAGRHAIGDRTLRRVGGFLARRHDFEHATRAALGLAESLVRRGRLRDAQAALTEARQSAARVNQNDALVQIAVLSGTASIDDGRLDDAEAVLSAAVSAAEGLDDLAAGRAARMALARCLFWRGRFEPANQWLAGIEPDGLSDLDAVRLSGLRSRLAVGRDELREAVAQAAAALERARAGSQPESIALASYATAFAHLAVGDYATVDTSVTATIQTARCAHDPLLSLRARLLGAESQRRQGRRGPAAMLCRRVRRMAPRQLPAIVRARADLLADLLTDGAGRDVAIRRARSTGFGALTLFAPGRSDVSAVASAVNDIVDILRCCQIADEDVNVLTSLCECLRGRLEAIGVAFFAEERGAFIPVAAVGGRIDPGLAARIGVAEQSIAPHSVNGRVEGGAPVRYGGRLVGAVAARWTPVASCDLKAATVLLTTAAAAAGPALAGMATRRIAPVSSRQSELLGTSAAIADVRRAVERAASAPFAVLVEGESGSGKELVARALHRQGARRDRPFCTLNCAALPEDLVESELFGHSRGAFTGALAERPGVFEEAHTGTLFLDEIGELSLRAQAKVLRTIQEGELRRVGENIPRRVDVRLIAATNRDLRQDVVAGRFRLDLLYRLDVIRIVLPPLRDRPDDIALLAEHFWREATARVASRATLGLAALARLARYDWPGNVREMQNVLAALAVRSPRRGVVPPSALPPHFNGAEADRSWRLDAARRTFETQFIRAALARTGGHRARAAEELGVTRQGLTKLMARLGLNTDNPNASPGAIGDEP